jgi:ABC-type phosphate/phosphonate transport system substrate-binding protein
MYDVTPQVRGHWHALLQLAARRAGVSLDCIDHAAPEPLTALWAREDLAAVFMCGYPLATRYPAVRPLAAPVTAIADDDHASYRSVWLVEAASAFDSLASTFGHRFGWTVEHSYSGFVAPRRALLAHRTATRPQLYRESVGPLGHPRAALAALADARIDVTAIDAYWWYLLQKHDTTLAAQFRAIGTTPGAPMPPLVCAAPFPEQSARRLISALLVLGREREARPHLDMLGIRRFAAVTRADYASLGNSATGDLHARGALSS